MSYQICAGHHNAFAISVTECLQCWIHVTLALDPYHLSSKDAISMQHRMELNSFTRWIHLMGGAMRSGYYSNQFVPYLHLLVKPHTHKRKVISHLKLSIVMNSYQMTCFSNVGPQFLILCQYKIQNALVSQCTTQCGTTARYVRT